MRQLSSIMISSILSPKLNENLQLIFEFLMNIGHKLEFNGKKRIQLSSGFLDEHNYYLQPPNIHPSHMNTPQYTNIMKNYTQSKELLKFKMSYEMSNQSTVEYTLSVKALLSIINALISKNYLINRYYIVKALELLLKLTSNSENENFFMNTPKIFLENLLYLLAVSNITITESNLQNSIIPENHIIIGDPCGKTRPIIALSTPLIHSTTTSSSSSGISGQPMQSQPYGSMISANSAASNYVGSSSSFISSAAGIDRVFIPNSPLHDQIDVELRDLVIDALHYLCRISTSNRQRFASIPNALKLIYKLASHPLQNLNYYNNIKRSLTNTGGADMNVGDMNLGGNNTASNVVNANPVKLETHSKAAYLFGLFGNIPEAYPVFRALRPELLLLACSDDVFAGLSFVVNFIFCDSILLFLDLVFNKLYPWMMYQGENTSAAIGGVEPMNIN